MDYDNKRNMTCEECGSTFTVKHEMGIEYIPQYCTFCAGEILPREERIDYEEEVLHWQNTKSCYNSSIWDIVKKSYIISVVRAVWIGGAFHRQPKYDFDTRFGFVHIVHTNINPHIITNLKTR